MQIEQAIKNFDDVLAKYETAQTQVINEHSSNIVSDVIELKTTCMKMKVDFLQNLKGGFRMLIISIIVGTLLFYLFCLIYATHARVMEIQETLKEMKKGGK